MIILIYKPQIYLVASIFVHTIFSISVLYNKPSWVYASTWALVVILESTFLVGSLDINRKRKGLIQWAAVEIVFCVLRISFLLALVFFYTIFVTFPTTRKHLAEKRKNESMYDITLFLNNNMVNALSNGQDYGNNAIKKMPGITRWAKPKIVSPYPGGSTYEDTHFSYFIFGLQNLSGCKLQLYFALSLSSLGEPSISYFPIR